MTYANSGVRHPGSEGGTWSSSVKSGSETMGKGRKEPTLGTDPREPTHKGIDGPLMRQAGGQSGQALGRKQSGRLVSTPSGQRKDPQGVPVGRGEWIGLPAITRERGENEKEGEQETQGEVP
jgi:hypothetical protein